MAPGKIKKAIGAVKDHTSIGLAMVGTSNNISDLEIAIIKATCHDEKPPHDRHVREIISLTTCCKPLLAICVAKIGRRLDKTNNWLVAVKTLMLVHRLLSEGDRKYHDEIFFAKRHRTHRFLNMSGFKDDSGEFNSWDFSAFVRTYARYLSEQLDFRMHGLNEILVNDPPVHEMKTDRIFCRIDWLKKLLDRFLACKPTGGAKRNKVVHVTLVQVVKESFPIFYDMAEVMATLIDRFMQLQVPDMVRVYDIFKHVSRQYNELDAFYEWCKSAGIMRSSNFPNIDKISKPKLDSMDDFIRQKSELMHRKNGPIGSPIPNEPEVIKEIKHDECVTKLLPEVNTFEAEKPTNQTQEIGDLLNLDDDNIPSTQETGQSLAMVVFDTTPMATASPTSTVTSTAWESFIDDSSGNPQWEAFKDPFAQGSTYQQEPMVYSAPAAYGNASRMSLVPQVGTKSNGFPSNHDPFALQMSEMERGQKLFSDDRLYWQQQQQQKYGNGMGMGMGNVHQQQYPYQYVTGGYAQAW